MVTVEDYTSNESLLAQRYHNMLHTIDDMRVCVKLSGKTSFMWLGRYGIPTREAIVITSWKLCIPPPTRYPIIPNTYCFFNSISSNGPNAFAACNSEPVVPGIPATNNKFRSSIPS